MVIVTGVVDQTITHEFDFLTSIWVIRAVTVGLGLGFGFGVRG